MGFIQKAQQAGGEEQAEKITKGAKSLASFKETGCFRRKTVGHSSLRVSGTVLSDTCHFGAHFGPNIPDFC